MVAEIWASVMLSFVDQLVALINSAPGKFNPYYHLFNKFSSQVSLILTIMFCSWRHGQ